MCLNFMTTTDKTRMPLQSAIPIKNCSGGVTPITYSCPLRIAITTVDTSPTQPPINPPQATIDASALNTGGIFSPLFPGIIVDPFATRVTLYSNPFLSLMTTTAKVRIVTDTTQAAWKVHGGAEPPNSTPAMTGVTMAPTTSHI